MRRPPAALLAALGLAAGCGKDAPPPSAAAPDPAPAAGRTAEGPRPANPFAAPGADAPGSPKTDPPKADAPKPAVLPPLTVYTPAPNPGANAPGSPKSSPGGTAPDSPKTDPGPTKADDPKPADPPTPSAGPPLLPPPPPGTAPPPAKPPEPKEKTVGSIKVIEYPTDISGKRPADFVKDLTDLDPFVRQFALRALPAFGPSVRREPGLAKGILARMDHIKELDPGVRAAAFEAAGAIGFDDGNDFDEAVRLLYVTADQSAKGGAGRLYAVQALTTVGPRAWKAVPFLIGGPADDPAYETRAAVATCLGAVASTENTGPSPKALRCLAEKLAHDRSAAVRLAAMQSLVVLGPPMAPRPTPPPGSPPIDPKDPRMQLKRDEVETAVLTTSIRRRLAPAKGDKGGATGLVEKDPQVEVFVRLALMRFDPKEIDDANLSGVTKYLSGSDTGVKLVALNALATLGGEPAGRKVDDVVKLLTDEHPAVATGAATALVAMGDKAKGALPALEKMKDRGKTPEEKEYWKKLSADAVRLIREAGKPAAPAAKDAKDGKKA